MPASFAPGFRSVDTEYDDHHPPVEGEIPEWLSGVLLRNGPGLFSADGDRVTHWFDGLAMLRRYAFADGELSYSNRFLRTNAYEDATNGDLTGQFATDERGWRKLVSWLRSLGPPEVTDNANVHVARFDGEYVALTETPKRVAFDPETLETRGEFSFADDIAEHVAAAHLVDDPHRDEWVGFSTRFGRTPRYQVYRVKPDSRSRDLVASVETDTAAYVHDCSVTRDHVVLVETPLVVSLWRALSPFSEGFLDALDWRPDRGVRVLVVDRDTGRLVADPTLPAAFAFHHGNAYDDGDDLVLDLVEFPDADIVNAMRLDELDGSGFPDVPDGRPVRYRVDTAENTAERTQLHPVGMEMPRVPRTVVGRRHRYLYAQGTDRDGANGLVKLDCETGGTREWWEDGVYVEEPIPITRPDGDGEDDGVVVATALDVDRERTDLMIFDASTLDVRARAHLPHAEPFGFHGRFFDAEP